jgi:hypothetical protein
MQALFLKIPVVSLADSLNHRLRALIPSGSLTRTFAEVSFRMPLAYFVFPVASATGYRSVIPSG